MNKTHLKSTKHIRFALVVSLSLLTTVHIWAQNPSNPVLAGFNPDPSVCRVGDDYYLVTSSFEYFPGVPVYHSKDLINWQLIGHAIHDVSQIDYSNVSSTAGIYAPTLRYHEGTFYVITTFVGGSKSGEVAKTGNFIVTAKHPAGPWSKPHWIADAPGIDPSLFFDDDGKVYYCGNKHVKNETFRAQRNIWIQEIDLETYKLKGKQGVLASKPYYEKDMIGSPVAFEAPHLYKKDGSYYLLLSHGGTGMGHSVSIWKSDAPLGPWEMNPANPILSHRGDESTGINCTGHADIFQTHLGTWYTAFLAVRSTDKKNNVMGRETFLAPVDWSGEWPIINPNKKVGKTQFELEPTPMYQGTQLSNDFTDEFVGTQLGLDWTFIRTPKKQWWSLTDKVGYVSLALQPAVIDNYTHPTFLGIRVKGMKASFETSLFFSPQNNSECAGLSILRGHKPSWTLVKEKQDAQLKASVYYTDSLIAQVDVQNSKKIDLKIELDNFQLHFFVKEQNEKWVKICEVDASEMGFPPAGRFTGSFAGLYASSRGTPSKNKAFFDAYRMRVDSNTKE